MKLLLVIELLRKRFAYADPCDIIVKINDRLSISWDYYPSTNVDKSDGNYMYVLHSVRGRHVRDVNSGHFYASLGQH